MVPGVALVKYFTDPPQPSGNRMARGIPCCCESFQFAVNRSFAKEVELSRLSVGNGDGSHFYDLVNPVVDKEAGYYFVPGVFEIRIVVLIRDKVFRVELEVTIIPVHTCIQMKA